MKNTIQLLVCHLVKMHGVLMFERCSFEIIRLFHICFPNVEWRLKAVGQHFEAILIEVVESGGIHCISADFGGSFVEGIS